MRFSEKELVDQLATIANLPVGPPDPLAQTAPVPTVDERIAAVAEAQRIAITGQQTPIGVGMQNRTSALRLNTLEPRVDLLEQLTQLLLSGASATDAVVKQTVARLELVRAAAVASDLRVVAGEVRLAALEAKDVLLASATEANRLDIVALKAADVVLQARASQDEVAIAAVQATATQARLEAAAAQKKADEDAAGLLVLQGQLTQAQAAVAANTASLVTVAADVAKKLPADAVQRFVVATPAVTIQVGTPATFSVPLPKAFTDNQYLCFFTNASGSTLLNVRLGDTAKLPGSFTATMQQTGLVQLAVQASSAEVLVIRLSN